MLADFGLPPFLDLLVPLRELFLLVLLVLLVLLLVLLLKKDLRLPKDLRRPLLPPPLLRSIEVL